MGFSLIWFAAHAPREAFLSLTCFDDTGTPDDYFEAEASVGEIPGGWTVLVTDDFELLSADLLAEWSSGLRLVVGLVDEDNGVSLSMEWRNGKEVWYLSFDRAEGEELLEASGELPPEFEAIEAGFSASEEEGGSLNPAPLAPLDLAEALTGFRHDAVWDGVFSVAKRLP